MVAPDGTTHSQAYLAAFDRTSGVWDPSFNPILNGPVHAIEPSPDGSMLYVGGEFTTINGVVTGPMAAINPSTGQVIPSFVVSVGETAAERAIVLDIDAVGSQVYVGGDFGSVNDTNQLHLARLNAATGAVDAAFTPNIAGGSVMAVEVSRDSRVFVGGQFNQVDGDLGHEFFTGLSSAGRLLPQEEFDQRILSENPIVFDILEAGDIVYIASQSNLLTLVDQQTLAKERTYGPDVANADTPEWYKSSDYQALLAIGSEVIAGNHSRWIGEPKANLPNGHIDSATGQVAPVNLVAKFQSNGDHIASYLPSELDGGVWALDDAGGGCIWIGGNLRVDGREDWNLGRVCEVPRYGPFATAGDFVEQQYLDFLGRPADAAGRLFWTGQGGTSTATSAPIINQFLSSTEFGVRREVIRLYLGLFQRLPDEEGLTFWAGRRNAGVPLTVVAQGFLGSAEFAELVGIVDNRAFAAQVYRNVLGREPDAAGLDFWAGRLDAGVSRPSLVVSFTESPEFVTSTDATVTVTTIYSGMLDRQPDPGGLAFWVARLEAGGSPVPLIDGFFRSSEYAARVAALPANN
ncbi:MAG: hypothetical protein ACI8TP_003413 [Acidimicrobiales bacterium]